MLWVAHGALVEVLHKCTSTSSTSARGVLTQGVPSNEVEHGEADLLFETGVEGGEAGPLGTPSYHPWQRLFRLWGVAVRASVCCYQRIPLDPNTTPSYDHWESLFLLRGTPNAG